MCRATLAAKIIGTCVVAFAVGVGLPAVPACAALSERPIPPGLLANERNTIEVFRRVSSSVVYVRNARLARDRFSLNETEIPRGAGSGFLWDDKGHVVTNLHVIRGGDAVSVTLADGTTRRARLVGYDERKDLAVLRIEAANVRLTPVELGDSTSLVVGQKVLAIGNPFGLDRTLTTGVISALGREIPTASGGVIEDVVQTDAGINPGNSGGPLLDSAGRLIGVNTAIYSPTGSSAGIGFAVPVSAVRRVVPQLIRHGKVRRAGLGVTVLPDYVAERWGVSGVIVRRVARDSPAARAGLRSLEVGRRGEVENFDVIIGIGKRVISDFDDLANAFDRYDPGDEILVRYRRDGKAREARTRLIEID